MPQPDGSPTREEVWTALFEHVRDSLGSKVTSCGRRHVMPPTLSAEQQPACFVLQAPEKTEPRPQSKRWWRGIIVLYSNVTPDGSDIGQETQLGATAMNVLLDAIDQALQPDNFRTGFFTLGGLVERCAVDGDSHVEIDSVGSQSWAAVPIVMLVP